MRRLPFQRSAHRQGLRGAPEPVLQGLRHLWDASDPESYPGAGDTWTDTIGGAIVMLTMPYTFSSDNGGLLRFVPNGVGSATLQAINLFAVNGMSMMTISRASSPGDNSVCSYAQHGAMHFPGGAGQFSTWYTSSSIISTPNGYYVPGQWAIVGHSEFSSPSEQYLYFNGEFVTSGLNFGSYSGSGVFGVANLPGFGYNYSGDIAVIMLYDRPLSAEEWLQNFEYYKVRFGL